MVCIVSNSDDIIFESLPTAIESIVDLDSVHQLGQRHLHFPPRIGLSRGMSETIFSSPYPMALSSIISSKAINAALGMASITIGIGALSCGSTKQQVLSTKHLDLTKSEDSVGSWEFNAQISSGEVAIHSS